MVAMFALFGVSNGVYHPADYAILSQLVSRERAGAGVLDAYLRGLPRHRG